MNKIIKMIMGNDNPWGEWPQGTPKNNNKRPARPEINMGDWDLGSFFGKKPGGSGNGGQSGGSGGGAGGGFPFNPDNFDFQNKKFWYYGGGIIIALWLLTGLYIVNPKEKGVELIFGKLINTSGEGLNYNLPWPIGEVIKPEVTKVNQVEVGFKINPNAANRESEMLTGDENIIDVQFNVFWRIKDAGQFIFSIRNPEESVRVAAEATMREIIGKNEFEYVRTTGRSVLAEQARQLLQKIMDDYSSGIEIVNINLERVDPPATVLDAFRDVQAARADKERSINEATAYLNEQLEKARGEGQQITQSAEAYKEEKISQAKGDSERFVQIYQEYAQNKTITRRRIYLETMEAVMGGTNKIIMDDKGGVNSYLPLNNILPTKKAE